ncbi:MAG: TlpA family protein disulfide reductase [Deltaproteobacteria bacterium]|nr:TlpA family protein disulfide reductase [Deltaproteobacteria bacterium]
MKRRALLGVGALVLLQGVAVLIYLGVERSREVSEPFEYERLKEARPAPALLLERPDGSVLDLAELRGRPTLLHFWATWCPPCKEELPALLELSRALPAESRPQVLAVSLDADWAAIRAFFGAEVPGAIVRDRSSDAHRTLGVSELPDTFLVTSSGVISVRFRGARRWSSRAARAFLRRELGPGE